MNRGEIWTIAGGADYAGKPRPALIVQTDDFVANSIIVCPFTSNLTEYRLFRVLVIPDATNGLIKQCQLMIDKIASIPKTKVHKLIGYLDLETLEAVDTALMVVLGLTSLAEKPTTH